MTSSSAGLRLRLRPFVSSLHPGLSRLSPGEVAGLAADLDEFAQWAGGELTGRIQTVRAEFRGTSRVPRPTHTSGLRLDTALADLVDPDSAMSAAALRLDPEPRETYEVLRSAVQRLRAAAPDAFGQRSRLRTNAPWNGAPEGPTALDIAGSEGTLALVVEFVDTPYNRVVVDSIGDVGATYSTSVAMGPDLQRARAVAQRLALGVQAAPVASGADTEEQPIFEVVRREGDLLPESTLVTEAQRLLTGGSTALVALFEARADGGGAARKNEFWTSVARLDAATRRDDRPVTERALEAHVTLVSWLLREKADVRLTSRGAFTLALTGAGGGVPTLIGGPPLLSAGLAAVGAMAATATPLLSNRIKHRAERRRLASALGDFVGVARTGEAGS